MGWSEEEQKKVYYAGLLHDVGKIRTQDAILQKNGKLTSREYEEIRLHSLTGYHILKEISSIADFAIGARWHHERYDGTGYPNGLSGENIPIVARVISVADAYDAMTSNRSYRSVLPQEKVRREIENGLGTQFDPEAGRIMLQMIDEDPEYRLRQPDEELDRVLLAISDDLRVRELLTEVIGSQSICRIIHEDSAEAGIVRLKRQDVDLVLLDISTERESGFEILSWIREKRKEIPVIVVSDEKDFQLLQRAETMGISDYLTKPLESLVLLESVENVLLNSSNMVDWRGTKA